MKSTGALRGVIVIIFFGELERFDLRKKETHNMETENHGCSWQDLPLEIGDHILSIVSEKNQQGIREVGLLMEVVLCFVCSTWNKRKPFWTAGWSFPVSFRTTLISMAATLGSVSMIKWLRGKNVAWDNYAMLKKVIWRW